MSWSRSAPARDGPRTTRSPAFPATWAVVAVMAALVLLQRGASWNAPFFSDDYILLDSVQHASWFSLVAPGTLAYRYYRPWSRELYHAGMQAVFGPTPTAFHIVSFLLYVAVMALFFTYVRRRASARAAALSTAFLAGLAAWGVLVEWISGVQDLWMMVWVLLALHAFERGRDGLAMAAFAMALLSKETAVAVPAIAFVAAWTSGSTPAAATRRVAPMLGLVLVWAVCHPALGGTLWWARDLPQPPQVIVAPGRSALRSVLSLANLDLAPRPESGWLTALIASLPGVLLLGGLAFVTTRGEAPGDADGATRRRTILFGIAWALLGWMPLALPGLIWQTYYTLLGAMGAAIAVGVALERHAAMATAVVTAVALLHGPRALTRSREWGNEQEILAGRTFMGATESWLKAKHPTLPRHSRLYFADVPRGVVFVLGPGDTPAVRVWYRDATLRGSYWSQYRMRVPGEPSGPDLFFRHDSTQGWIEVVAGRETVDPSAAASWISDHENLAYVLVAAGNVDAALLEYEKLAAVDPRRPQYAFMAGLCAESRGDWARAARWFRVAAENPSADDEMRAKAREFATRGG